MSKIWGSILIFCVIVAIITGNAQVVIDSIMNSGKDAVENVITLIGMMCFWSGIFNIFEKTSAIKSFSNLFSKIIDKIFDKKSIRDETKEYMSLNIASNIVGIGNASTINGIKAIEMLQEENDSKELPSNNMTTFVLINTASIQLIPTSIIALRSLYGSSNSTAIVVPIWIVTCISLFLGLISIKLLNKKM